MQTLIQSPSEVLEFLEPPFTAAKRSTEWGIENAQDNAICKAKAVIGFAMAALGARPEDEHSMEYAHLLSNFLWAVDQHLDELKYLNQVQSEKNKQQRNSP